MSREQRNARIVRRLFEEVINGQRYDRIPEYCAEDVLVHRPGNVVLEGVDAYTEHYRRLHAALGDFEARLEDVVVDGDRVATRFSVTGTHEGELLGVAPTGTQVAFTAQVMFHLDGEIVEEFHHSDRTSLREQL